MGQKLPKDELLWLSNVDFWIPRPFLHVCTNFFGEKVKTSFTIRNFVTPRMPVATRRDGPFLALGPNFGWAEKQGSHSLQGLKFGSSS
jgi:hypothetical protein